MSVRAALAFATTSLTAFRRDRARFERWQARQIQTWLREAATQVPALAHLDPSAVLPALPVMDKTDILSRFPHFNTLGLRAAEALRMADGEMPSPAGVFVGASTGTTGPRQPYVISENERQTWLGVILAKSLGLSALRRPRVAVVLPRGSALYDAAARRLPLRFIPIGAGFAAMTRAVSAFRPQVVVAPPRALRWLAEHASQIAPQQAFSGAEVLDPIDRDAIHTAWPDTHLGEIYMATEGLLGVTCRHGTLHLAEDRMHFELEPISGDLVTPIITDFSRRTQIMARYRMNDVLRMAPPCPCGSVLRAVAEVQGRCDDMFLLGGVPVTPDIIRDAILAQPGIADFRVRQVGPSEVEILLPPGAPAATESLRAALARAGATAQISQRFKPISPPLDHKLRRVERVWSPDQTPRRASVARNRPPGS